MPGPQWKMVALVAAVALSGCSYGNDALNWASGSPAGSGGSGSSMSATAKDASSAPIPIAPSRAESNPEPTNVPPGGSTMVAAASPASETPISALTFVGQKARQLRGELDQFRSKLRVSQQELSEARLSAATNSTTYFNTIAAINSRLQIGTTPGNPDLVAQWSRAQSMLDHMNSDVARLNTIANEVAADSSFGNYVLNEVRSAYTLQGGTEADRDQLHQIENQTLASQTACDQLLNSLSQEITRQSAYVTSERNNLVTLALAIQNGQLYGPSLANRSFATTPTPSVANSTALRQTARPRTAARGRAAARTAEEKPLVVIRFDQPDVAYEQPLYTAVSRALERKPSASFTVMAVAPNAGTPAQVALNTNASRQNAENVLRALTNMGLPADRVTLSATMSPDVQANEVRVFVR
jgi:hypothetical protein